MYDVAIVGYGPSGVVAAALLGQSGLRVHVCDRLDGVYEIPRAVALDHEIMRVFQQIGVARAVEPFMEPFTDSEYLGVDGRLIRRMTMIAPPYPQGYTPSVVFTQPEVERVLRSRVAQLSNVEVDLGAEMRRISQGADAVELELETRGGGKKRIVARYAIACDGGSSSVRAQLGMPLEDLDFDEPWLVVDVLVNEQGMRKLPKVSVQYCEPERPCTLVLGPGNHRRFEISLLTGEDPQQAATTEATWRLLSRWLGPEDGELWRQSSYRFHALVAAEWRRSRVFLAGDAAHMQPPFLGQGMCQGIRDVANLSWKLAAVLNGDVTGRAGDALLDSYGLERGAHVRELTSRIKSFGAVICERDIDKARARDARMRTEGNGAVRDTPRQDILPRLERGLLSAWPHPCRGRLFPQPRVRSGAGTLLLDQLTGNGWRLMLAHRSLAPRDAGGVQLRARVVAFDDMEEADGVVAAWFMESQCVAALVRPDNYIYGVARSADEVDELLNEAAAALDRHAVAA
ncbi:bifunctional 3-(3-hydroxy-phenyl)propionate/3-hydroxycinnamic acid hydroxylase [Pigmentiphaga sp. H8]|nr:bifunctional 3-(3-hydroxy-phenyl)propionate/3-hydroxycinnamic acid hydroxylase [Pigmentiphaga sp. H8]